MNQSFLYQMLKKINGKPFLYILIMVISPIPLLRSELTQSNTVDQPITKIRDNSKIVRYENAKIVSITNITVKIPDNVDGVINASNLNKISINSMEKISIMVTLKYHNQNQLNDYLEQVQNPNSSLYHQYLISELIIFLSLMYE